MQTKPIPKTVILLPILNERENLPYIFESVSKFNQFDWLFLEGGSQDKSREYLEERIKSCTNASLYTRKLAPGIGEAYKAGFQHAIDQSYETVFQMDADGSHDLSTVPAMLERMETVDAVFGSRFLPGSLFLGSPWWRKQVSHFGCLVWRSILNVSVSDVTGGFNCYRVRKLQTLPFHAFHSGYPFQAELKTNWVRAGFSFVEFPIHFAKRSAGKSKFKVNQIWEGVKVGYQLYRSN